MLQSEFEIGFFGLIGTAGLMLISSGMVSGFKWLVERPLVTSLTAFNKDVFWLSFAVFVAVMLWIMATLMRKRWGHKGQHPRVVPLGLRGGVRPILVLVCRVDGCRLKQLEVESAKTTD